MGIIYWIVYAQQLAQLGIMQQVLENVYHVYKIVTFALMQHIVLFAQVVIIGMEPHALIYAPTPLI